MTDLNREKIIAYVSQLKELCDKENRKSHERIVSPWHFAELLKEPVHECHELMMTIEILKPRKTAHYFNTFEIL
jgi:hypothetical protein